MTDKLNNFILIYDNLILEAISVLSSQALKYPGENFTERLDNLRTEFHFMTKYFVMGAPDPKRSELFSSLKDKLYQIDYDLCVRDSIAVNPYFAAWHKVASQTGYDLDTIKGMSDIEMAFRTMVIAPHWRNSDVDSWTEYLSESGIKQATLISALSLSCIETFSKQKMMCLARIFHTTKNEVNRQRALVGCMLALIVHNQPILYQDRTDIVNELLNGIGAITQIVEMQMQMIHCTEADHDAQEINTTIMPEIMKNQPFIITKKGLVERDENEDENADSDELERKMDELEESIQKVQKMQRQGADIFFGGFKQMKRFPFFHNYANWLMPFTLEHPDVKATMKNMQNTTFLDKVTKQGPFCDSDKYSFVFAMAEVINTLPENVRKMMEEGEVGPIGMHEDIEELKQPAYIRRQYLQDLFRFYSINAFAKTQTNPFQNAEDFEAWFIVLPMLSGKHVMDMGRYLLKKDYLRELDALINLYPKQDATELDYLSGEMSLREAQKIADMGIENGGKLQYMDAIEFFNTYLQDHPNHQPSLRGIAKAYYNTEDYEKAAFYYDALRTINGDRMSYTLNYCVAMVKAGHTESVLNDLYRLNYEKPDNNVIANTLGWTLLYAEKPDKALAIYEKIPEDVLSSDVSIYLNYAYAHFVTKCRIPDIRLNAEVEHRTATLLSEMQSDKEMLHLYGIKDTEMVIMAHSL